MKNSSPLLLLLCVLFAVLFLRTAFFVSSQTATHIVFSEIQLASVAKASDEFVELYNPTINNIDITGWHFKKRTMTGTSETNVIASLSGSLKPHGFFLMANNSSYASPSANMTYSTTIADNNTLSLYDQNNILIDKVGIGQASDFETTAAILPAAGKSIERKANQSATSDSMVTGADMFSGNGEDTDNNFTDFILRDTPQPQNSNADSEVLPAETSTPTATPTITITPTNTPKQTPIPTQPALTPTDTPTPIPTATPMPAATDTPTPTPSEIIQPTQDPTTTQVPTPILTVIPTKNPKGYDFDHHICQFIHRNFHIWHFHFWLPWRHCSQDMQHRTPHKTLHNNEDEEKETDNHSNKKR